MERHVEHHVVDSLHAGTKLGYPICCIGQHLEDVVSFENGVTGLTRIYEALAYRRLMCLGYVPCDDCILFYINETHTPPIFNKESSVYKLVHTDIATFTQREKPNTQESLSRQLREEAGQLKADTRRLQEETRQLRDSIKSNIKELMQICTTNTVKRWEAASTAALKLPCRVTGTCNYIACPHGKTALKIVDDCGTIVMIQKQVKVS